MHDCICSCNRWNHRIRCNAKHTEVRLQREVETLFIQRISSNNSRAQFILFLRLMRMYLRALQLPSRVPSLLRAPSTLFKRRVEQGRGTTIREEDSSLPDAWLRASVLVFLDEAGILIERRQKAAEPGSPCFSVASIILSPRSSGAVLHSPQMPAHPLQYQVALTTSAKPRHCAVRLLLCARLKSDTDYCSLQYARFLTRHVRNSEVQRNEHYSG